MTNELLFGLLITAIVVALILVGINRQQVMRGLLDRLKDRRKAGQNQPHAPEQSLGISDPGLMTAEESEAELERLQKLIDSRRKLAWNSDISHHLWDLYRSHLRYTSPHTMKDANQSLEWYDLKILQSSTQSGMNKVEFELKGTRYRFIDNEEKQAWREQTRIFSLFLYDDSDRCLIEIPMKMKVDGEGRQYAILTGGPNAFLPGEWVGDFISVKLKHQRIRNQEIRAQKHQERLREIADLKARFGISD